MTDPATGPFGELIQWNAVSRPSVHEPVPAPAGEQWPPEQLEAVPACPVCGVAERSVLFDGLTDRVFGAAPGSWRLVRCAGCASGYLDPRPTPASIGRAYEVYYTHGEVKGAAPRVALHDLRQALANDHLRARWGYEVEPAATGGRLLARLFPLRGATVDREIRHLPARSGARLLDVGSGDGAAIARLRTLGWDAEGLDPDPDASRVAANAGIKVTRGTLADLDGDEAAAGAYDAVTLSHVIEHLHDPAGDLERIHRLLKPGGLLWIATPNLEALGRRRFGRSWVGLDPPRHLVIFTTASLDALLRRTGFEPEPTPRPAPMAWLSFRPSAAISEGRSMDANPERSRRRLRALAVLADRLATREPRHADELIAVARRRDDGGARYFDRP
jgi:2-polyprenyl-3-methyl-5-hydroxy-6-metoxy-1,4-benzoquinol methylase